MQEIKFLCPLGSFSVAIKHVLPTMRICYRLALITYVYKLRASNPATLVTAESCLIPLFPSLLPYETSVRAGKFTTVGFISGR